MAQRHYDAGPCGFSVAATEHSTTTIWGRDSEQTAFLRFLNCYPTGVLSVVADSYDLYHTVGTILGERLKDEILQRDGKLVVRPDSGVPHIVAVAVLNLLWEKFGGTHNEAGYKVLNPKVGVIYGDGIEYDSIDTILHAVISAGFCVSNIVFGQGGGLLQKVNRDTQKFAFKCAAAEVEEAPGCGKWIDVFKDPVTDKGKRSKRGRLKLINEGEEFKTVRLDDGVIGDDLLETVFENGTVTRHQTFDAVRELAHSHFLKLVEAA